MLCFFSSLIEQRELIYVTVSILACKSINECLSILLLIDALVAYHQLQFRLYSHF